MTNTTRNKVSRGTLERENLLEVQTEKVEMTLNTDNAIASGLLIQRLTELYENPIEASVRETVSNAIDAICQNGSNAKGVVKITSPTNLQPIFKVEDTGCGMSYEDLKEIYAKYGASTKMNNFDQIGAYGLGAKAPLAYGTEFTVSSTKDGVRTTIIVAREELTNYIKIVDSVETDSPNGTTVSIPVASNDIHKFNEFIETYKTNPMDKDNIKLIINEEEVTHEDYIVISEDMVIYSKDGEEVTGRIWIKNEPEELVRLLTDMTEYEAKLGLNYIIGAWAYSNPQSRSRYNHGRSNSKAIFVELKPGIVGFNSSRDAILENDRYIALEELVIEYLSSAEFANDLFRVLNDLEFSDFKKILNKLLLKQKNHITVEGTEIKVNKTNSSSILKNYSLDKLEHKATGYSLKSIVEKAVNALPVAKDTAVIDVKISPSYNSSLNKYSSTIYVLSDKNNNINKDRLLQRVSRSISASNEFIDNELSGNTESMQIVKFLLELMIKEATETFTNVNFITDVDYSEEKSSTYQKVKKSRKAIVDMNEIGPGGRSSNYIVFTKYSKSEIEKLVKIAMLKELNVSIKTAEETVEIVKEYRKKERGKTKSTKVATKTSTLIYEYSIGEDKKLVKNTSIQASDIEVEDGVKNVIILSKNSRMSNTMAEGIINFYCNENDLKPSQMKLYVSYGIHRVADIEALKDLGELHESIYGEPASTTNIYKENVIKGKLGTHAILKDEPNAQKISFVSILMGLLSHYNRVDIFHYIESELLGYKKFAKIAGIDFPEVPSEILDGLSKFMKNEMGGIYSDKFNASSKSKEHLAMFLTKEQKKLIEDLGSLKCVAMNEFTENKSNVHSSVLEITNLRVEEVERIFKSTTKETLAIKLVKSEVKLLIENAKILSEEISKLKFN